MAKEPNTEASSQLENQPDQGWELPLPDPYPEYVPCPHCGEPEVEVWCYQTGVNCHRCAGWIEHTPDPLYRVATHNKPVNLRLNPKKGIDPGTNG